MKGLVKLKRTSLNVRVVLLVTSLDVCWYRCQDLQITDQIRHSLDEDPKTVIASNLWLKNYVDNTDADVELIVDTELDDLDRVKLLDSTNWFCRSWHLRKVLWQLRREYPEATVSSLPKFLYPEIASVLYEQLATQSSSWLGKLSDSRVVVSHVVTSTELLVDWFRIFPHPVLLHMFDGRDRHRLLLTVDGLPLHLRQSGATQGNGNIFADTYLSESLKYLSESVFRSFNHVLVVFPRDSDTADTLPKSDDYLAKLLLGLDSDVSYQHVSFCKNNEQENGPIITIESLNKGRLFDLLKKKPPSLCSKNSKYARITRKSNRYLVNRCSVKFRGVLQQSIATVNARKRSLILRRCTYLVFLLSVLIALASSRSGILSLEKQEEFSAEHTSLDLNLQELMHQATALHESPSYVMDSINRIQDFEKYSIPTPLEIMKSVSSAMQVFPSVSLTGFSWSVVDEESESDYVTVSSVSIRDKYWGEEPFQSKTIVEMSGQLVSQSSLRQKQNKLDSFLNVLSKSNNISDLQVIDSPAKSASSSHSNSESGGVFKIQFSIKPI